ncbi:hypothetical protein AM593_09389, partial [Mytilus galloprovincialis]
LPVSDHPNESEITVNTERKDGYLNVEIGLDVSSAVTTNNWHNAVNSEPMSDEANSEINLIVVAVISNSLLILTGVVLFMCAESHCTKCCKRKTPD